MALRPAQGFHSRFTSRGVEVRRPGDLAVRDALGRMLPARMSLGQGELRLEVDDAGAIWPVTIDPTISQQAYLKAGNPGVDDWYGWSVAISGDMVVAGAFMEDSSTTGANSLPNEGASNSGAAYIFMFMGFGPPLPEIAVSGNGQDIADSDTLTSATDGTDFGIANVTDATVIHAFAITNLGLANLTIAAGGIGLSGVNVSNFAVSGITLSASIAPNGSAMFFVIFDSGASGPRSATISIANNDSDENSYDFAIQGMGDASPAIIAGAPLIRQRGSAGTVSTIATVNDGETPVGSLAVTATTVPAGIAVTSITNGAGIISATIAADCTAVLGVNTVVITHVTAHRMPRPCAGEAHVSRCTRRGQSARS